MDSASMELKNRFQNKDKTADKHAKRLKQAYLALSNMEQYLEKTDYEAHEPIAIVGMGCRFPKGIDSLHQLWQLLESGNDVIAEVPSNRWNIEDYYDPDPDAPGKMYTRVGGFLNDPYAFDAHFFNITPREAMRLDPQHRLLLEVAWESIEDAGVAPLDLKKSKTGVFVGISTFDYAGMQFKARNLANIDAYFVTGSYLSMAAGRLAYTLGVNGPALSVDTACSSSLLALHLACQSLRKKECQLALCGGVNLILSPELTVNFCKNKMLSLDGKCHTFDAEANGYVRGEGCGMVVLKRLSDAKKDQDRIIALVRGSAVNHDGASAGITVPNGPAQKAVIEQALIQSRIDPKDISYVEAHGTGTSLGDPIELEALGQVFGQNRTQPLYVGSIKTNLGHTEAAAGIAGVLKTALMMQHQTILPHLNFKTPNPKIDWQQLPVTVPTHPFTWPGDKVSRKAGISAFGASGTNVHVVLESYDMDKQPDEFNKSQIIQDTPTWPKLDLLVLSAKDPDALKRLASQYAQKLKQSPRPDISCLCAACATKRSHFAKRLAVTGQDSLEMAEKLEQFIETHSTAPIQTQSTPRIAFLFTGQGSQYPDMGKWFYRHQPVFAKAIDQCEQILSDYMDVPLKQILFPTDSKHIKSIDQTQYTQPALFAFEYALATLLKHWGLIPDAVMGHSVGEYVAACVASVMSLEDALRLIATRAALMGELPLGGKMAVIMDSYSEIEPVLAPYAKMVSVAAFNGPKNTVLSGLGRDMDAVTDILEKQGKFVIPLTVSNAFHSPLMEPMLDSFTDKIKKTPFNKAAIPLVSNVTGSFMDHSVIDAAYWTRHIRMPVRFEQSIQTLVQAGYNLLIEIGPKPILTGMARQCLDDASIQFLPMVKSATPWADVVTGLAQLYQTGIDIDWKSFYENVPKTHISLPTYPFSRKTYRFFDNDSLAAGKSQPTHPLISPLLGHRLELADSETIRFESIFGNGSPIFLKDHVIHQTVIMPAAGFVDMALTAGKVLFGDSRIALSNLTIWQPMIVNDGQTCKAQLVLDPKSESLYEFKVYSKNIDRQNSLEWELHIQGTLELAKIETETFPKLDLAQNRCRQNFAADRLYQIYADCGLTLGKSFKAVTSLKTGENQCLGEVEIPDPIKNEHKHCQLHPALLDACFQVAGPLFAELLVDRNYLPVGIENITYYKAFHGKTYCHAQLHHKIDPDNPPETLKVDLCLYDQYKNPVAQVLGLQFRKTDKEAILKSIAPKSGKNLYQVNWKPQPIVQGIDIPYSDSAQWLIVTDHPPTGNAFAKMLNGNVTVVGTDLLDEKLHLSSSPRVVLVFDRLDPQDQPEKIEQNALDYSLLLQRIAGKIISHKNDLKLWLVTLNAQPIGSFDHPLNLSQSVIWGIGQTLMLEHPGLKVSMLDSDTLTDHDSLKVIAKWLTHDGQERHIAVRDAQSYVARIEPAGLPIRAENQKDTNLFKSDATYLITGGLGGLGLVLARWMGQNGARHLVLCSRSNVTDRGREISEQIDTLQKNGINIVTFKADVSKQPDVTRLIRHIKTGMPRLKGIIHAAGVVQDKLFSGLSIADWQIVMKPKISGALFLKNAILAMDLDFWINFSSMASVLGSQGQANYAAANRFLDAMVHMLPGNVKKAMSIAWGPFSGSGMAARNAAAYGHIWQEQGISLLDRRILTDTLAQALISPIKNLGVFPLAWPTYLNRLYGNQVPRLFSPVKSSLSSGHKNSHSPRGAFLETLKKLSPQDREPLLLDHVRKRIAGIMQLSADTIIDLRQRLFDSGMDSLMAVELKNQLENDLDCKLTATLVFDYPTLESILAYLKNDVLPDGLIAPEKQVEDLPGDMDILDDDLSDDLDEDDLARLLAQELEVIEKTFSSN